MIDYRHLGIYALQHHNNYPVQESHSPSVVIVVILSLASIIINIIESYSPPFYYHSHRAKRFLFHKIKVALLMGTVGFVISLADKPVMTSRLSDLVFFCLISLMYSFIFFTRYNPYHFKEDGSFVDYFKERYKEIRKNILG